MASATPPTAASLLTCLAVPLLLAYGCEAEQRDRAEPSAPTSTMAQPAPDPPAKKARAYYRSKCLACHGARGDGNGPGAATLKVKPRSYRDSAWQKSVTDDQLRRAITEGGPAVGLDKTMTSFPDLEKQPEVLSELVNMIRAFGPAPE